MIEPEAGNDFVDDDEETFSNEGAQCPYCGHENHVEGEDYTNDGDYQERQCYKCDKVFMFSTNYSVHFEGKKARCLNGGEHEWRKTHTSREGHWKHCKSCGKEQEGTV